MAEVPYTSFDEFTGDVLDSDVPVMVQFTASWCGPCKAMEPSLIQIHDVLVASKTGRVVKVDVEQDMELAEQFEVRTVPTFILFWDGDPVDRSIGAVGMQGIVNLFTRNSSHAEAPESSSETGDSSGAG